MLEDDKIDELCRVKTFTEKPTLQLAKEFIESGDFVWNSGIFIWRAKTIIDNFSKYQPEIAQLFTDMGEKYYSEEEKEAIKVTYYQCKNISIDYGIMEHAEKVYVLKSKFGWSDLGTWKSLFEVSEKNEDDNVLQGNIMAYETKNTLVKMGSDRLALVQGLDNFIVAENDNVLLICHKDEEQRIKQFLSDVKETKGEGFD